MSGAWIVDGQLITNRVAARFCEISGLEVKPICKSKPIAAKSVSDYVAISVYKNMMEDEKFPSGSIVSCEA